MTVYELQKRLSDNIKRLRKDKYTQETLAEEAGISVATLNGIEGCRRWLSEDTLVKLADALQCDISEFFLPTLQETGRGADLYSVLSKKIIKEVQDSLNNTIDGLKENPKSAD